MSERFKIQNNKNNSKNTRLPIREEFHSMRFGRDALAHLSRYLLINDKIINLSKKLNKPLKIIDIGCGDVYVLRVLSKTQIKNKKIIQKYVGIDVDEKSIKRTIEDITAPSTVEIMDLQLGDITEGYLEKFKDKEFDLLINLEVIEHLQPKFVPKVLKEYGRISRYQYISTPNITGGSGKIPDDHIKEWDTDELMKEMEKSGLKVLKRIGIFCNLNKVKKLSKLSPDIESNFNFFKKVFDKYLLSIIMAKFLGTKSQNILYICKSK